MGIKELQQLFLKARKGRENFLRLEVSKIQYKTYLINGQEVSYDPRTTLIIKARHGFGDNLMVTAVIEGLKQEHPNLQLIVLAKHPEIFTNNPHVYSCFDIKKIQPKHPVFRVAIDLEYQDYFKRRGKKNKQLSHIDGLYVCLPVSVVSRIYTPKIYLTERERDYGTLECMKFTRPLIAISPYGKKESEIVSKIYPKDKWNVLVKSLIGKGITIIQVGALSEGPLIEGCYDWRDIGYRNTAAVLAKCDAIITHVGGIMHLAVSQDTPCVAIFGGIEDPEISGYKQNRNICVSLDCAPCWRKKLCSRPTCCDMLPPELICQETIDLLNSCGFEIK
jgi:ADP-heptose:LPS heptosyltransferase